MDDDLNAIERTIDQRRPRIRPPQKMADVLSNLFSKRGYARVIETSDLQDAWHAAAGPKLGGDSRPGLVKRGALEVLVRNSAVLQELTFMKKKLVEKLQVSAAQHKIKDLKFKVGVIE